ncbi:TlpA family protein disulfide reductase [Roseospira marina]|uniref:TlpA family protein disulfide reductase n=1 Tax=Roseospira marina TaxID=140057 RepID=A0A5M6IHT1_9PROT|nr:TlpA disulfide reductase family protein [Roseospira marina]KAA5607507.1 TlpA family protein disulfide reductase [Roseospira marina]MBB4312309.1 thiol-disulfide isomerase/thioredoxin [Roseospira marina]MBB5085675.1 thiol-disulfide isomerase/thioredoxin [Roseospira marina]
MSQGSTRSGPLIALAIFVIGLATASATLILPQIQGKTVPGMVEGRGAALALERVASSKAAQGAPFRSESGDTVTLEDFRGKIVVLNFWATWCGPCVREMPTLDRLHARLAGDRFAVVAVSTDRASMATLRAFFDTHDITHLPVYHDPTGDLSRAFGITGLPTTVVLDAEGREVASHMGYMDWDQPDLVTWFHQRMDRARGTGPGG